MNLDLYCSLMNEVKKRDYAIDSILKKETTTAYQATNLEFMYLQMRKILELTSLASLVANKEEFEKQKIKYANYWNAERIMNDIESKNSMFYPKPVVEKLSKDSKIVSNIEDLKEGYLTRNEFVKVYEKCGKIMHAENPFGSRIDYSYYEKQIEGWLLKIRKLLNSHIIKLIDDDNLYLVHMKESRDDNVHGYIFGKLNK